MINRKSAEQYCSEDIAKIENYAQAVADTTQTWDCHHRLEVQGQFRNSKKLLKKCGMYYHVPASQLIFLTKSEHRRLHLLGGHLSKETRKKLSMAQRGKHLSEETRKKMSLSHSGEKHPMFGKHHSEEARKKMSLSQRGKHLSEETKKKMSMSRSGEKHYMFGKHHSEEARKKMSAGIIGRKWWNNGIRCIRSKECPGEGWVRGRKLH